MSKEFTIDGNRFDLSNYHGRLQHFLHMVDPRALLLSDANVREAQSYIAKFRETGTMTGSNENMWAYQNLINSAVHPATGDLIPKLCRVSAIAPINIPIVYAMMMVPPTNVAGTLVMHIANQSYNAACNYFNRSGAAAPLEAMATAYGLAVSSACAIAYSMGKAVSKFPVLQRFSIMIPILSTCAASSSNLAFTRADELKEGADVYDEQGNCYGKSIVAGKQGIIQTALSRCVLVPFAVVMFPTACTKLLEKTKLMPKTKGLATLVQLSVIYVCFQLSLPATLAIFPQTAEFKVEELEAEFQQLKNNVTNEPIRKLYANKGL